MTAGSLLSWIGVMFLSQGAQIDGTIASAHEHKSSLMHLAVSEEGKRVITAGHDHTIKIWSVPDLKLIQSAKVLFPTFAGFLNHDEVVVTARKGIEREWQVHHLDIKEGKVSRIAEGKGARIVDYWPKAKTVVFRDVIDPESKFKLLHVPDKKVSYLQFNADISYPYTFSADKTRIVGSGGTGTVVIDLTTGITVTSLPFAPDPSISLRITPDNKHVLGVSAESRSELCIWDIKKREVVKTLAISRADAFEICPKGATVAVLIGPTVNFYDIATGIEFARHKTGKSRPNLLRYMPDGESYVIADSNGRISLIRAPLHKRKAD